MRTIPLPARERLTASAMLTRAAQFADTMTRRRTVRDFAPDAVPAEIIAAAIRAAATAPNGANLQPWHFVAISDPALKHTIRLAAEEEERAFYAGRATPEWLEDLAPLGTDPEKPFLDLAPWLIAIFSERWRAMPDGSRRPNYYVPESVGIATGFLIAALHHAGLATLTHTPSPMGFLGSILGRPPSEKPFLLLVVGFPAADARVPDIGKKPFELIATFR